MINTYLKHIVLFSIYISCTSLWALDVNVDKKVNRVQFHFKNTGAVDYFCPKVTATGISYYDQGEYIYSLDASIQDRFIPAENQRTFVQEDSQELIDLFKDYPTMIPQFENSQINHNCEISSSRLNHIFVIDDRRECHGDFEVKSFDFDSGKLNLKNGVSFNNLIDKNAKIFNLSNIRDVLIYENGYMKMMSPRGEIVTVTPFTIGKEVFLSAAGVDNETIIAMTYSLEGIKFYLINYSSNVLTIVKDLQTEIAKLDFTSFVENPMNQDEMNVIVKKISEEIEKYMSVYLNKTDSYESIEFVFSFRAPIIRSIKPFFRGGEYSGTKAYVFSPYANSYLNLVKADVLFKGDLKVVNSKTLSIEQFQKMGFIPLNPLKRVVSFKEYKVSAGKNNLILQFKNERTEVSGFCNIVKIFSDKLTNTVKANVNDYYNGQTLLEMAVKSQDYEKALRLISEGAKVDYKSSISRSSPIDWALSLKDKEMMTLLVNNGARIGTSKYRDVGKMFELNFLNYDKLNQEEKRKPELFFSEYIRLYKNTSNLVLANDKIAVLIEMSQNYKVPRKYLEEVLREIQ